MKQLFPPGGKSTLNYHHVFNGVSIELRISWLLIGRRNPRWWAFFTKNLLKWLLSWGDAEVAMYNPIMPLHCAYCCFSFRFYIMLAAVEANAARCMGTVLRYPDELYTHI